MTQEIINVGSTPNDGLGDPIRTAFIKSNSNFTQLYNRVKETPPTTGIGAAGDQEGMTAYDTGIFYYCFADYNGVTPIWIAIESAANISTSSIGNGTTTMSIPNVNGNVLVSVGGTSNVVILTSTGINTAGYVTATGNITGNYFVGNGSLLTGLSPSSISNGTSNVSIISSGGNIRASVGGTANVVVISATGANVTGTLATTSNISGPNLSITSFIAANVIIATGNVSGGNLSGTNIGGSLTTAAQANITSVGTLTSLAVTGNTTSGNLITGGLLSATGNVSGGNLSGTNIGGSLTTAAQANITSVGTLVSLTVTGNVTGGNLSTGGQVIATGNITGNFFIGNGSQLTGVTASGVTVIANGTSEVRVVSAGGNANISIGGTSNVAVFSTAGANITGIVGATGNITGGNLTTAGIITVNSGNAVTAIVNAGGNAIGNIGSSSSYFDRVFAQATTALYADLAENYLSDASYPPGTVVSFGGDAEITKSNLIEDKKVAGVVSTNPSYLMNGGLSGEFVLPIALTGRVPCLVYGPIAKGDMIVSAGDGRAKAKMNPMVGTVLGKAIESFNGEVGTIEIAIGKL